MLARTKTFTIEGLQTRQVTVEVDIRRGCPAFTIVGLADASVREARERVQAAILNSGLRVPGAQDHGQPRPRRRARRSGPGLDLALACGVLAASEQLAKERLGGPCAVRRAGARRRRAPLPGHAGGGPGVRRGGRADARARPGARAGGDAGAGPSGGTGAVAAERGGGAERRAARPAARAGRSRAGSRRAARRART